MIEAMWVITRQIDLVFTPAFFFSNEADARAVSTKLNNVATAVYSLFTQPLTRRAPSPIYDQRLADALGVLQSWDPDATVESQYHVSEVVAFVQPSEGAPSSANVALFRAIRDLS